MDVHNGIPEGAGAKEVADADEADLETQEKFGVNYINYWLDEKGGEDLLPGRGAGRRGRQYRPPRGPRPGG